MPKYESVFMERALALAQRGLGHTRPNPPVGAVVVKGGKIIGEGWHRKAGGDHAEVAAIKNARRRAGCDAAGDLFKGTTLYVRREFQGWSMPCRILIQRTAARRSAFWRRQA